MKLAIKHENKHENQHENMVKHPMLDEIIAHKKTEIAATKASGEAEALAAAARAMPPTRGFAKALAKAQNHGYGLIAEFKRKSPSRPTLTPHADPEATALAYEAGGASCMSVLTDTTYFGGSMADLTAASRASLLPMLCKDFILDPIQIAQARTAGADCILLILACLDDHQAKTLEAEALSYGLDVLIETHNETELRRALSLASPLIGINNRDLTTMQTDLATSENLLAGLGSETMRGNQSDQTRIFIAESGMRTPDDLHRLARAGVRCFLIGEALMEAQDNQRDIASEVSRFLTRPLPRDWQSDNNNATRDLGMRV